MSHCSTAITVAQCVLLKITGHTILHHHWLNYSSFTVKSLIFLSLALHIQENGTTVSQGDLETQQYERKKVISFRVRPQTQTLQKLLVQTEAENEGLVHDRGAYRISLPD